MDILCPRPDREAPLLDIRQDLLQSLYDLLSVLTAHDLLFSQHGHMGDAAPDILPVNTLVKG